MSEIEPVPEDDYPLEKLMKYATDAKKAEDRGDKEGLANAKRELNLINRVVGKQGQVTDI